MKLTFRKLTKEDVLTLREFSIKTYYDTFMNGNSEHVMQAYLDEAFAAEKLTEELQNPDSTFRFLYADGTLAGYLKVNRAPSQTDLNDPASLELERIYAAKKFQGKGIGQALMNKAVEIANGYNKKYIWLGVWEKNERALAFYRKNGFVKIGEHAFYMGDDCQTDFVMSKDLIES